MKELIEALTGELEDIKLFLECEEYTNRLIYKSVCEKLEICWKSLSKAKREQPKNEQNAEEFLKSRGITEEAQMDGYVLYVEEIKDLLEEYASSKLPSDEEVREFIIKDSEEIKDDDTGSWNNGYYYGYISGGLNYAKWMKEQLKK